MRLGPEHSDLFPPEGQFRAVAIAGKYGGAWNVIDHEGRIARTVGDPFWGARLARQLERESEGSR